MLDYNAKTGETRILPDVDIVPSVRPTVERSPLYVRRWLRARGKEAQYDALIAGLTGEAKADYAEAVAFAWDDPVVAGLRGVAVAALGMTEAELRACFEE